MLGYKGLSLSWAVSHLKMFDSLFVKCDSVKQGENICFSYFRNGSFKVNETRVLSLFQASPKNYG